LKTKEETLCVLLDIVFESAHEPDWAAVLSECYFSGHGEWLLTEVFKLLWLCNEDQAAFDEAIWRLTNGNP
jgi:hypothetical protein